MLYKYISVEWKSLEQFGITSLTREADATDLRMLCDLDETGVEIMSEYYGSVSFLNPNWNSGAVKSCFVSCKDVASILVFCLLHENPERTVCLLDGDIVYTENREEFLALRNGEEGKFLSKGRVYHLGRNPRRGLSNVHAFTGRAQ